MPVVFILPFNSVTQYTTRIDYNEINLKINLRYLSIDFHIYLVYYLQGVDGMNKVIENKKELILLAICSFIYMSIFTILENMNCGNYIYTETMLDNYIPFLSIFVIPYILWFAYIALGFVYFLIYDKEGFYRTTFYIFIGMYICLVIYMLFPNAQGLRVDLDTNNFFHKILSIIYTTDTSTNVCPSIHTYNSIMMYIALIQNEKFASNKIMNISSFVLTILICLSTVFTKQHAIIDVFYAFPLCVIVYYLERSISYTKYLDWSFWKKKLLKV